MTTKVKNDAASDAGKAIDKNTVTLTNNRTGESFDFPILDGSEGPSLFNISSLYARTGMFTYDPGFTSTGSCSSAITFIDGEKGILLHRGYPIEQLVANSNFWMFVTFSCTVNCHPKKKRASSNIQLPHTPCCMSSWFRFYRGFKRSAHPMAVMVGVVGALSAFYHSDTDIHDPIQRMIAAHRLIAKMPTIGAYAYKYSLGQPFMYPKNNLNYSENLLRMMFAVPAEDYQMSRVAARRSTEFLSFMRITSRTPRLQRSDWQDHPVPIRLHVSPRVSRHCGDRLTVEPMKRY